MSGADTGGPVEDPETLHQRATALIRTGRLPEARVQLRRAVTLAPAALSLRNNLGVLETRLGDHRAAAEQFRQVSAALPGDAVPCFNHGEALHALGEIDQAIEVLRRAATLDPDLAEPWTLLAQALLESGRVAEALGPARQAARLCSEDAAAQRLHADVLQSLGRLEVALPVYTRALELDPADAECWYGLGHAQLDLGLLPAAVESLERCLASAPGDGRAAHDLGKALHDLGCIEAAMPRLRRAAESALPAVRALAETTIATIVPGSPADGNASVLAARAQWAARQQGGEAPKPRPRGSGAPLRLGYVSSFFGRGNWMKPVWALLNRHDRRAFEVHLFCDLPVDRLDAGYQRRPEDALHDISECTNDEAAARIRAAGIDVLIDLNGYSVPGRMPLYALRPAPLIVGWFNLYATTGMSAFDVLIGDDCVIPPAEERHYVESIVRVPGSYLTFEVLHPVPEVVPPPCLASGVFTFGSLVSQYKLTDGVLDAWCQILQAAPASRLLLRNAELGAPVIADHLRGRFAARGVGPERLELLGRAPHLEFLCTYDAIDLALDAFPYNGGTTTTEALWQGVPVMTFAGDRWASRTSASLLAAAGLDGDLAADVEDYVGRSVAMALNRDGWPLLRTRRLAQRERLRRSAVCDAAAFARAMERIYRALAGSDA